MQFQVPQFIEIEDKLFGPFTFKQFIYLAGGAAGCFLTYRILPAFLAYPLIAGIGGLALALTFYKVNDRPFIFVLEAGIKYALSDKLYKWRQTPKKRTLEERELAGAQKPLVIPKTSASKLKDLAWSLDIQDKSRKQ